MKVYLDVSCMNRPFDDQGQARIRLESEAVMFILERIDSGSLKLLGSEIIDLEVAAMPDAERRRRIELLFSNPFAMIGLPDDVVRRAAQIMKLGFGAADALHIASAEKLSADVLLTCDDRLVRLGRKNREKIRVEILNPIHWLERS